MRRWVEGLEARVAEGGAVSADEALRLMQCQGPEVYDLLPSAHSLARRAKGWDAGRSGRTSRSSRRRRWCWSASCLTAN